MDQKTVLIVIPTYRREDRVERAVLSALNQTYPYVKVVVVDDNGKGNDHQLNTEQILGKYIRNNKITYLVNEVNSGGSFSRNQGLFSCESDFVTFLDDDDEIYPNKTEEQVNCLEKLGTEYSCCYSAYDKLLADGIKYLSSESVAGDCYAYALSRSIYVGSGSNLLVRTIVAKQVGGYDISFKKNQDLEFLAHVLKGYLLAYVDKPLFLVHYEIRENNFSNEVLVTAESKFIETFKKEIDSLGKYKAKRIYRIIAIERFRICLGKGKSWQNFVNCLKNDVGVITFTKYFIYLIKRVVTKKSYGFRLF